MRVLKEIMDNYYNGKISAPAGFDVKIFYEKTFQDRLLDNEKKQVDTLLENIKIPTTNFLNSYYEGVGSKVLNAIGHVG